MARAKTPLWERILLVLFGLCLTVVLLESGLQLGGFILASLQEYRNIRSIRQKGSYRILCLGESTTQNNYPRDLESILNQRSVGITFSVIDKGWAGINTSTIVNRIGTHLDEYRPDMVVAMMGINDPDADAPYPPPSSKTMLFFRSLKTYKLGRLLWLHMITKAREVGLYKPKKPQQLVIESRSDVLAKGVKESSLKTSEPSPDDESAFIGLGDVCIEQGKFREAEEHYRKALALNPKSEPSLRGLGRVYRAQNRFQQEEECYRKALASDPQSLSLHRLLADVSAFQGKMAEAEEWHRAVLALYPKDEHLYISFGVFYWFQGKAREAEEYFRKAFELNPHNETACLLLGGLYLYQRRFQQAEECFKRTMALNTPHSSKLYGALANLYAEMGEEERANDYYRRAADLKLRMYNPVTVGNYHKLKEVVDKRKVRFVCVQYPMREVAPLKQIFSGEDKDVIFVDNEKIFKQAVAEGSYRDYFADMFAGDFGHCTKKGNRLLAENIATVILKEVFNK